MDLEIVLGSKGEKGTDGRELSYRREGVGIVDPMDLSKPLRYESCLVFLNFAIGSSFDFEDPLRVDNLAITWTLDFFIQSYLLEHPQLILHRLVPQISVGPLHHLVVSMWLVVCGYVGSIRLFRGGHLTPT